MKAGFSLPSKRIGPTPGRLPAFSTFALEPTLGEVVPLPTSIFNSRGVLLKLFTRSSTSSSISLTMKSRTNWLGARSLRSPPSSTACNGRIQVLNCCGERSSSRRPKHRFQTADNGESPKVGWLERLWVSPKPRVLTCFNRFDLNK